MIEMSVQTVTLTRTRALAAALREAAGPRVLGVGVGRAAAAAVQCGLRGIPPLRPLVWAALLQALRLLGGDLVRTVIDDDGSRHAQAYFDVRGPRGITEVPCSTEDAVVLAALAHIPVFVRRTLLGRQRLAAG